MNKLIAEKQKPGCGKIMTIDNRSVNCGSIRENGKPYLCQACFRQFHGMKEPESQIFTKLNKYMQMEYIRPIIGGLAILVFIALGINIVLRGIF